MEQPTGLEGNEWKPRLGKKYWRVRTLKGRKNSGATERTQRLWMKGWRGKSKGKKVGNRSFEGYLGRS